MQETKVLFQSNLVRIEDYRCREPKCSNPREERTLNHEIVLPRSGVFSRRDASGSFVADSNQILFFNRGQTYQIGHPLDGGDRSTIFIVQTPVLLDLLRAADPGVDERPDRPFLTGHLLLETRLRFLPYWLLHSSNGFPVEAFKVEEQTLLLLGEMVRHIPPLRDSRRKDLISGPNRQDAEIAERVKIVLGNRFRENLKLDEISRAIYISPYHLCRVFKRTSGLPIHQYLQRLRLAASLQDLAERRGEPLAAIALDLGFSSHNHFSAVFRKAFGLTPSQFRSSVSSRRLRELSKILKV